MNNQKRPSMDDLLRMKRQMESNGMSEKQKEQQMLRFAGQNMNPEQQRKLQTLLQDKEALQTFLQSQQAQNLLQRLRSKE